MRCHFVLGGPSARVGVCNLLAGGCSGREGVWINEPQWHLYRLSAKYHRSGNKPPISGHEYLVRLGERKFRRGDTGGSKAEISVIDSAQFSTMIININARIFSIGRESNEDMYGWYQFVDIDLVDLWFSENLDKRACVVRGSSCGLLKVGRGAFNGLPI